MGLDIYLYKLPRFKNCTPKEIFSIAGYLEWLEDEDAQRYTVTEWCGIDKDNLPTRDSIEFYKQYSITKPLHEEVGYWRKANAIHAWFVDNVQNEVDDCGYYEVSKECLERLLDICTTINDMSKMEKGFVKNGERLNGGIWCPILEEGEYIANPEIAAKLLPTQVGFFFGSTEYDQWYMRNIDNAISILNNVLNSTDFNEHMIVYHSSW
jgi:hypothetical protein